VQELASERTHRKIPLTNRLLKKSKQFIKINDDRENTIIRTAKE